MPGMEPYTLVLFVASGDLTQRMVIFARADEVESAWEIVEPTEF